MAEEKFSTAGVARKGDLFFLAKRKPGGDLGGKWEFPGGKVDPGETPLEGLCREWQEELEISITPGEPFCEGHFVHKGINFTLLAYEVKMNSEDFIYHEHTESGWFTLEEMSSLDIAESDLVIVNALKVQKS